MAIRSIWKGTLALHPLMKVPVALYKAVDGYEGSIPLRQVDAENAQPFVREEKSISGKPRLTVAAQKAGATHKTHVECVRAVEVADGDFRIVPDDQLKAIEAQFSSPELVVDKVVEVEEVPLVWAGETYYLTADTKIHGADESVATLYAALVESGKAIVTRWMNRGHEHVLVILPSGDNLVACSMLYAQEQRDADDYFVAHRVANGNVGMVEQLLDAHAGNFDIADYEDGAVEPRAKVIDAVAKGKKIAAPATPAAPASAPAALVDQLKAAVASSGAKKAAPKKATAKPAKRTAKPRAKA